MLSLYDGLPVLLGCGLLLGLVFGTRAWRAPRGRRRFVTFHPAARAWLRRLRLTEPEQFLDLEAVIVSGHPGRNVARLTLGEGADEEVVYLKREERVPWRVRLLHWLAGHGAVSRSVREAQVLQALEHEGLPAPHWLAAGEDERGRAFLLVRGLAGAVPLVGYLRAETDPARRRQLARRLGAVLAQLHEAGLEHRDLYAKHVLVEPASGEVFFLDWQRARRRGRLSDNARARDLAALHATLADSFARLSDRMAFAHAYLQDSFAGRPLSREAARAFLARVEAHAARLLLRRHVREKRQPPREDQAWICLEGEGLCVTPALRHLGPRTVRDRLGLDNPLPSRGGVARRWLTLPGVGRTLLLRRRTSHRLAGVWSWLSGRPVVSPEQRQAALLMRLARHEVAVPRVLAMGQSCRDSGEVDSFLLVEPAPETAALGSWLARRPPEELADRALRLAGALVARLHEASCYFSSGDPPGPLAVRLDGDHLEVVFDAVEGLCSSRAQRPDWARRDLVRVQQLLALAGCGPTHLRRFLAGYHQGAGPTPAPGLPSAGVGPDDGPRSRPGLALPPPREPCAVKPDTLWQRLVRGATLGLRHRPDWPAFVGPDWVDGIMQVGVTDRFHFKQGRSTGRWVLTAPGPGDQERKLVVYLKRHHELPRWQGLLAVLWPWGSWSPAFQEWDHLEWAARQGVPVPAVVAAGEFLAPGGRLQSFLAVEELTDMLALNEAVPLAASLLEPPAFRAWKRGLVAEMARLARLLHDRRCFHKDLYLCHFFIHKDDIDRVPEGGWRGKVSMIDLHRLARHPWTWRIWQLKDLAQLLYSSEVPGVDTRDRVFFWQCYRGLGPRPWGSADRWLRRLVLFKWRRYRRHNLRRKARLRGEQAQEGAAALSKE